nr:MAG TPA: hypothetical protein [Caudoviricetes sp.]
MPTITGIMYSDRKEISILLSPYQILVKIAFHIQKLVILDVFYFLGAFACFFKVCNPVVCNLDLFFQHRHALGKVIVFAHFAGQLLNLGISHSLRGR